MSTTPSVRVVGAKATGIGTITPAPNAGHVSGDIEFLFVETANEAASLTTAAGFAAVTGGVASVGTAAGADGTRMTVFWRRWNGTDGSPTLADSGDHTQAVIISYRDCIPSGQPWEVITSNVQSTATTAASATGVTTTKTDSLIVVAAAQALPDQTTGAEVASGPTNASLTSLGKDYDDTTNNGNGGAITVFHGTRSGSGASGTTTWTSVTSSTRALVTFSLYGAQTTTGSFSTDAIRLRTQQFSFSANAVIYKNMPGSFSASSIRKANVSGFTYGIDATKKKNVTGSFRIGNASTPDGAQIILYRRTYGFVYVSATIAPQLGTWSYVKSTVIINGATAAIGRIILSAIILKRRWFGPVEDGPPY